MGTVYKKTFTKPLPTGAEIVLRKGQRLARWKDSKGRTRTAPLTTGKGGAERIIIESPIYIAKWRDGDRIVRVQSTGCRDETAARGVLADLERRAELVKAKVLTSAEDRIAKHQATPLPQHFEAFEQHLQSKGRTVKYRGEAHRRLLRLAADCSFAFLADLSRERLERWLAARAGDGMAAQTRNDYLTVIGSFCNWCVASGRLIHNPFTGTARSNVKTDRRHLRRAMAEEELVRLLDVAWERPCSMR
jgi:hypothetical protein